MTKFNPIKIKNSSIQLPDEFLDALLLNDGDHLLIVEDNGRFYIRKTRQTVSESTKNKSPPKTFDELASETQGMNANNLMKMMEDTLKNPEMRKMVEETAKGLFKAFSFPPQSKTSEDNEESNEKSETDLKQKDKQSKEDDDEDSDEEGHKIDIE